LEKDKAHFEGRIVEALVAAAKELDEPHEDIAKQYPNARI